MNKLKLAKFRKGAIAALCAVAVTCTGLAAACSHNGPKDGEEESTTSRKEDTQLLRNGNFEYATVPEKAVHFIKNVPNWSRSGDSSGTMSGIVNTSSTVWEKYSDYDYDLKGKLDANNDLKPGDSDYEDKHVDYNGMDSGDILYVDPYVAALAEDKIGDDEDGYAKDDLIANGKVSTRSYKEFLGIVDDANGNPTFKGERVYFDEESGDYYFDSECTHSVRYAIIDNPETHYGKLEEGKSYRVGDEEYKLLVDEDGNYYFDLDGDGKIDTLKDETAGNVLMIHNYPTNSKYNGISQYYSSQSITLEANTAAEISVWVKTSDLKFDKGYVLDSNEEDRGAYIEITQSVASTSVDSFKIKAINTEKILADNPELDTNNGWLKYTIYVNACDFASSTVSIRLGLGDSNVSEKVTGYAFFDDVEVKKFIDFDDKDENGNYVSTYTENEDKIVSCLLISEAEDKIFYADKQVTSGELRHSTDFYYLIDLASEDFKIEETMKQAVNFDNADLTLSTALTTYEDSKGKIYASAVQNGATIVGIATVDSDKTYNLPDTINDEYGRPTFNDLIGVYGKDVTFSKDDFKGTDDSGRGLSLEDLSPRLNDVITGDNGLKALDRFSLSNSGSMLLMLSRYGAAYTTTLESENFFTVKGTQSDNNYMIVSFWVKTSDMNGSTAATVKLVDVADEDNSTKITVDSTNVKTNVGGTKDIYNGWVQCFFFVQNDTDADMTFKLEFSFGNTDIKGAAETTYNAGWAAMANLQTLEVSEDVFKITSAGTYSQILTKSEESPRSHTPFDEATNMKNVKKEIANPAAYNGTNGGSSNVVNNDKFGDDYDKLNNKKDAITGLINRDGFANYNEELQGKILSSFVEGASNWNDVFGKDCYQPLIIVDTLRTYYDRVIESEDFIKEHYHDYYVLDGDVYRQVKEDEEYDPNETYYSLPKLAKNYGYLGNYTSVASNSYKTISVKVMVTGDATAWVYLVDASNDVLSFGIPEYTYNYDDEGNVLNAKYDADWTETEHRDAIVYKLRNDGLYDGEDGVYANLSNLTTRFKYHKFENNTFYTADGEVSYDDLEDGVMYYSDKACTTKANHYLVVDEQRIYEYADGHYYYLVNGERSVEVKDFSHEYARGYKFERDASDYEYAVKVENTGVDANGKPKWVTVNFVIATGNAEKNYRLELWSGERDKSGAEGLTAESQVNGAVAFDYSNINITSSNYSSVVEEYQSTIKEIYINLIANSENGKDLLKSENLSELNLKELADKVAELGISKDAIAAAFEEAQLGTDYVAEYYTFSWYDSAQYVPFNLETAEAGQTGYDYKASSYSESLIYFKAHDLSDDSYNVFVDYSAVDQTIDLAHDHDDDDDGHDHGSENNTEGQSGWLLITSIILFVVLVFVLVAMLIRYLWKNSSKKRSQKQIQKNNYKQRERYIRKLGLVKAAPVEEAEEPATETPSTETTPVEAAPVEETPVEEAPAEEPAEAPTEGENKDE